MSNFIQFYTIDYSSLPNLISSGFNDLKESFSNGGSNIIESIKAGIGALGMWLYSGVTNIAYANASIGSMASFDVYMATKSKKCITYIGISIFIYLIILMIGSGFKQ